MGRSLKIRKPRKKEMRKLHQLLEEELSSWQRRRSEAILLFAGGLTAIEIAQLLEAHVNTIYSDLQAFDQEGLDSIEKPRSVGMPVRITNERVAEIIKLAEVAPYELGLPYGRWSLRKLRNYLIKQRVIKAISYEHLRRLLKKGGYSFVESSAKSSVTTHNVTQF